MSLAILEHFSVATGVLAAQNAPAMSYIYWHVDCFIGKTMISYFESSMRPAGMHLTMITLIASLAYAQIQYSGTELSTSLA
jgi:hypothetical protein